MPRQARRLADDTSAHSRSDGSRHVAAGAQQGSTRVAPGEQQRRRPAREGSALDRKAAAFGDWIEAHPFAKWGAIVGLVAVTLPPGIALLAVPGLNDRLGHYA